MLDGPIRGRICFAPPVGYLITDLIFSLQHVHHLPDTHSQLTTNPDSPFLPDPIQSTTANNQNPRHPNTQTKHMKLTHPLDVIKKPLNHPPPNLVYLFLHISSPLPVGSLRLSPLRAQRPLRGCQAKDPGDMLEDFPVPRVCFIRITYFHYCYFRVYIVMGRPGLDRQVWRDTNLGYGDLWRDVV